MALNPLTLAQQDWESSLAQYSDKESSAPMAIDDQGSSPAHCTFLGVEDEAWINSCLLFPDLTPESIDIFMSNPHEDETPSEPSGNGDDEIRTCDMEDGLNPSFSAEMESILRLWDLKNSELEDRTLADILASILAQTDDCLSYDGPERFGGRSSRPSVDAFDFRDMKSALEEQNVEGLSAVLGGLDISASGNRRNRKA